MNTILPPATHCWQCGYSEATTVCRMCKTDKSRSPDTHDFRDYHQPSRPDYDLDARGRPLKQGT